MRANYTDHGVDEYYRRVGATYRNPHYPGIRSCIILWLNKWWEKELVRMESDKFLVLDLACGSGEVTAAVLDWWQLGRVAYSDQQSLGPPARRNGARPPPIGPDLPKPSILAADPYTAQAFHTRTGLYAAQHSFRDIAEGALTNMIPISPPVSHDGSSSGHGAPSMETPVVEMVICSFALHLIEKPSELFTLLRELSTKCRWLVVLAPHKKPDIKDGWGWRKWDTDTWAECGINDSTGEFLEERVHCRVYRSVNV
ncbi:Uncharacterized protein C17A5.05c [Grifola frondosa]|uniref:Uncharacterized protein C17A5.05c n=1 Tax=Grifola frondosa TaxID=5627 RepID=A0A1C7M3Y8_GRIFR|nr:Uncharacterized protein C17A5.05c [Grifola frondosa]